MAFPRRESWNGLPFPSSGDLPDLGIQPVSPALAGEFFTTKQPGRPPGTEELCPDLAASLFVIITITSPVLDTTAKAVLPDSQLPSEG